MRDFRPLWRFTSFSLLETGRLAYDEMYNTWCVSLNVYTSHHRDALVVEAHPRLDCDERSQRAEA